MLCLTYRRTHAVQQYLIKDQLQKFGLNWSVTMDNLYNQHINCAFGVTYYCKPRSSSANITLQRTFIKHVLTR